MKLEWFGTAALMVSHGNTAIAFDPFGGIPIGTAHPEQCPSGCAQTFTRASDVFVTHGHFDHILQIPFIYQTASAVIHATPTPCHTLKSRGFPQGRLDVILPDQHCAVGDFTVAAYQGRHCQFDRRLVCRTALRYLKPGLLFKGLRLLRLNRQYPENGEILFYEIACGDRRLQIMGSMGLAPDVPYPTGADTLILPYQGKSNPVNYAASLVERLMPQRVLLDHYDDSFPPMTAQVETSGIEKLLVEKFNIPCYAMKQGIIYDI